MPFNPDDQLAIKFTVNEWNQILAQLQEGPYKITAPLITKINMQAAQQEQQHNAQAAAAQAPYSNGEMQPNPQPVGDIVADIKVE